MAYIARCTVCRNPADNQFIEVDITEDPVEGWKYAWHHLPGSAEYCPNSGRPVSETAAAVLDRRRLAERATVCNDVAPRPDTARKTKLSLVFNSKLSELQLPGAEALQAADVIAGNRFVPERLIHLTIGAPPASTPQGILDVVSKTSLDPSKQSYVLPPYGSPALLESFAYLRARVDNVHRDPSENVCAAYGGREALLDAIQSITEPGDVVLGPGLGYPGNHFAAVNARCHFVRYSVLPGTDLREEIEKALLRAHKLGLVKVLIVVPVGNPFGAAIPDDVYPWLIEWALKNRIGILSDEAYAHSLFEREHVSTIQQFPGGEEVAVSLHTLAKLYSVPGWRMAFLDGNRDWVEAAKKVISSKFYGHYWPLQAGAMEALKPGYDWFFRSCGVEYGEGFRMVRDTLTGYGVQVLEKVVGGMFAAIKCDHCLGLPSSDSVTVTAELYKASGVRLNPGVWHGPEGDTLLRLALVKEPDVLREASHRVGRFLAEVRHIPGHGTVPRAA